MSKLHFFYILCLIINLLAFFIIQVFTIFKFISYNYNINIENVEIIIDIYQKIHAIIDLIGEKIILNIPYIYNYLING